MLSKFVNISDKKVFREYSDKYKIFRALYDPNGEAIEFFDLDEDQSEKLKEFFVSKKLMFYNSIANRRMLLLGKISEFEEAATTIRLEVDEELGAEIVNLIKSYLEYDRLELTVRNKNISAKDITVMGILNVTPDSFSDGGKFSNVESAYNHAKEMIENGVDIIDVGGESTRPGSEPVTAEEEIERVIPVIEKIRNDYEDVIISIDTNKAEVAEKALLAGADIINDISAGTFDNNMFAIASKYKAPMVLMHIKGKPSTMQNDTSYSDLLSEVYGFLKERINIAKEAGVEQLIVDPGIGFGKSVEGNFALIERLGEFKSLGRLILIGLSRKSFLGNSLNLEVNEREVPTIISETISAMSGARIIRTHNVKNAVYLKKLFNLYYSTEKR